jgi:NADH:ubiquinone oxidoreductase subunit F (NADH-binding)/(2Fe-2S) ferredoxin/NAD-dependent dihydropyrimidine dehydrogenase PreA subunit
MKNNRLSISEIAEKHKKELGKYKKLLMVCTGTGCVSAGAFTIKNELERLIKEKGLEKDFLVVGTGCNGFCAMGPIIVTHPDDIFYQQVKIEHLERIIEEHLLGGKPVEDLVYKEDGVPIPIQSDIPFFGKQTPVVLRNKGIVDPEKIESYLARDGYVALEKALSMPQEEIIEIIKESGLRGRGGAGFPTWMKWKFCREAEADQKYMICNGDEGDPGAFMNRSLFEADPHAVLEGLIIAAYTIGANKAYIYIRAEYPLAVDRLKIALNQMVEFGLVGDNILGSDFSIDIKIKEGAGAFVCGEETALISSIEGKRGMPRTRPPFPAQKGLWGKPTIINNVETLGTIPIIIRKGADWYTNYGTPTSKGTKTFSLVGCINHTGLIEVPMGTTLREIIFDIGGGIPNGKKFKAVQTGGPSGGCLSEEFLDLPVDYENLGKVGSIMGSGGLIVMDEDTCIVDLAKYFLKFTQSESCGKCVPCRVGTRHMVGILEKITSGNGEVEDLEKLETLAHAIKDSALCGLGQTAPNPVLSTLKYFRSEYLAHVQDKRCPATVCKDLIVYRIIPGKCTGCQACVRVCPTGAISGPRSEPHNLDESKCIKCRACFEICRFDAVAGDAIVIE